MTIGGEPFAKPIAVVQNMMGIASLYLSYALADICPARLNRRV
jgi:hypothetical protein